MSNIKVSGTPVRFSSLTLIISTKPKKYDYSSDSASDDQHGKRAQIRIEKELIADGGYGSNVNIRSAPLVTEHDKHDPTHKHSNISRGCSLQHVQPGSGNGAQPKARSSRTALAASHSPNQPRPEPINPTSPAKANAVAVEDSGCTGDWDRDSVMGASEDEADQNDDEPNSETDSWESATNSSPKSATRDDCLMCSDTKDAAVKSAHKKFCKRCRPPVVPLSRASRRMHSWSRLEIIATLCGEATVKPLTQSRISLLIWTPAPLKWVGWWSTLTSYFRLRQLPMQEMSTPESMRPMS